MQQTIRRDDARPARLFLTRWPNRTGMRARFAQVPSCVGGGSAAAAAADAAGGAWKAAGDSEGDALPAWLGELIGG